MRVRDAELQSALLRSDLEAVRSELAQYRESLSRLTKALVGVEVKRTWEEKQWHVVVAMSDETLTRLWSAGWTHLARAIGGQAVDRFSEVFSARRSGRKAALRG